MNSTKLVGFELCYVSASSQVTGSRTDAHYLHVTETSITYTLFETNHQELYELGILLLTAKPCWVAYAHIW